MRRFPLWKDFASLAQNQGPRNKKISRNANFEGTISNIGV